MKTTRSTAGPGSGRRAFLRALGGAAACAALPILPVAWRGGSRRRRRTSAATPSLPPRTVGLRSLGGDFVFDPAGLRVGAGDTVTWLNLGDFHTVTSFHPSLSHLVSGDLPLRMPRAAEPFHSGYLGLDAGPTFERRVEIEGVYDYLCQPHYGFGMVGRLVVGEPRGGPATSPPSEALPEPARTTFPSIATITGPRGRVFEWAARLNGVLLLSAASASESRDPAAAARAVAEAVRADAALADVLADGALRRALEAVDAFRDEVAAGAAYGELVDAADRAKEALSGSVS